MSTIELVHDAEAADSGISVRITNGDGFAWDEIIEGVVTIHPPESSFLTYSEVSVGLVEQDADGFMTQAGFAGTRDPLNPMGAAVLGAEYTSMMASPVESHWGDIVIARELTLSGGDPPRHVPFTLPVSRNLRLAATCFVAARAVATDGVDNDKHAAVGFVLMPPRPVQAIQNTLRTFGNFVPVEVSDAPGSADTWRFTLDYVAPAELKDRLDGIRFDLVLSEDQVAGVAEVNPQEKSLADHLRSFFHADRIRFPLAFDRAELDAAGKANSSSASVKQRLHELLDIFLNPMGR